MVWSPLRPGRRSLMPPRDQVCRRQREEPEEERTRGPTPRALWYPDGRANLRLGCRFVRRAQDSGQPNPCVHLVYLHDSVDTVLTGHRRQYALTTPSMAATPLLVPTTFFPYVRIQRQRGGEASRYSPPVRFKTTGLLGEATWWDDRCFPRLKVGLLASSLWSYVEIPAWAAPSSQPRRCMNVRELLVVRRPGHGIRQPTAQGDWSGTRRFFAAADFSARARVPSGTSGC